MPFLENSLCRMLLIALTFVTLATKDSETQQLKPADPGISGTITAVETKGRTTTVKFTNEAGQEYEFPLTPKTDVEVISTGDDGFLAAGLLVRVVAIESNDFYFGSNFYVYPQFEGRIQPAKATKAPPVPGQSKNLYSIAGEIVRMDDKGDAKYHQLQLKVNPRTELPVYVEPNHRVHVVMTDPEAIKEGQSAVVVGRTVGAKLLVSKLTIKTGETLKSAEVLPMLEARK